MSSFRKPNRKHYHKRTIEMDTYEYDEDRLIVAGCLTDRRFQEYYPETGEKRDPGVIHKMIIHLLVDKTTLEIEDLRIKMPIVPHEDCLEAVNSLESVKGLRIARGFTAKLKDLAGSGKGCSHLVALLTSMASSTVQGYGAYHEQALPNSKWAMNNAPVDACWTWRTEGPLIKLIKEKQKDEKPRLSEFL